MGVGGVGLVCGVQGVPGNAPRGAGQGGSVWGELGAAHRPVLYASALHRTPQRCFVLHAPHRPHTPARPALPALCRTPRSVPSCSVLCRTPRPVSHCTAHCSQQPAPPAPPAPPLPALPPSPPTHQVAAPSRRFLILPRRIPNGIPGSGQAAPGRPFEPRRCRPAHGPSRPLRPRPAAAPRPPRPQPAPPLLEPRQRS